MLDPIPINVKCENKNWFSDFSNITLHERAEITVDSPVEGKYNISYLTPITAMSREVWVETPEKKISLEKDGVTIPIIVLTEDEELLPYCMKDRLASLQDNLNKCLI